MNKDFKKLRRKETCKNQDHSLNQSESSLSLNGVEPDQAPVNRGARLYDSQVLSSLSWLQKHGFDVDKPAPSSSATNLQSAKGNAPSMHAMIDALDEMETKPEDTVEDEHRPLPENELHRKSKKKPKKKSSVQEVSRFTFCHSKTSFHFNAANFSSYRYFVFIRWKMLSNG